MNSTWCKSQPASARYFRASRSSLRLFTSSRTISPGPILRTISPYTQRMVSSLPGQSVGLWGQPNQVASWGSHSAGMAKPSAAGVCSRVVKVFGIKPWRIGSFPQMSTWNADRSLSLSRRRGSAKKAPEAERSTARLGLTAHHQCGAPGVIDDFTADVAQDVAPQRMADGRTGHHQFVRAAMDFPQNLFQN